MAKYNLNTLLKEGKINNKIEEVFEYRNKYYIRLEPTDHYDNSLWELENDNLDANLLYYSDFEGFNSDELKIIKVNDFLNNKIFKNFN